ncbi:MAG: hypothetical protein M3011_12270 [Actinomycetota bacterium]|nr:hypothetical protein [Actinomycetota bacterium]
MPRTLPLSDKAVEFMVFLATHGTTSEQELVTALWPLESPEDRLRLAADTVAEVNRVVVEATGNTTPVMATPSRPLDPTLPPAPKIFVRILTSTPYVEVYDDDEHWPGADV